jgi:hypothetical protein
VVGRDEVRDGGVEAAGEVVGEAGGKSPPRGESHGGGGGQIARWWEGRSPPEGRTTTGQVEGRREGLNG